MHMLTMKEITSALNLCADVFSYPSENCIDSINHLGKLVDNEFLKEFCLSKDELESIYIQIFSVGSSSFKTVPYASYWIDGKMMGNSCVSIESFYKDCGYEIDKKEIKVPADHIGVMLSFLSILLEDEYFEEAKTFLKNYMFWICKLKDSLENVKNGEIYSELASVTCDCLDLLEKKLIGGK